METAQQSWRTSVRHIVLIAGMMLLWAIIGFSLGGVLHLQGMLDAAIVGGLVSWLVGIDNPWPVLTVALDIAMVAAILAGIGWLSMKSDAQLQRLVRGMQSRLMKRFPAFTPDDRPKWLTGLGYMLAVMAMTATLTIFGCSVMLCEETWGPAFNRSAAQWEIWLYAADNAAQGAIYPLLNLVGAAVVPLKEGGYLLYAYATGYRWGLSAVLLTLALRTLVYFYGMRHEM
jgi:hypothetical protein